MNSPTGQEYALESMSKRATSIIVRKGSISTLLQRTEADGLMVVDISPDVQAQLMALWGVTTPSVVHFGDSNQALLQNQVGNIANLNTGFQSVPIASFNSDRSTFEEPPKRRGRPPKA